MKARRFSYTHIEVGQTIASELAYLPITVSTAARSVEWQGMLDSGSTVNILPYPRLNVISMDWNILFYESKQKDIMADLKQFKDQQFLSLETFRKNGIGVKTPVWFAQEGDMLYIWTRGDSAKVKRIRNNARVNIAPCKRFGAVTGEWQAAQASVDDSDGAVQHVVTLLRQKLGFVFIVFGLIEGLIERRKGQRRVSIKVSVSENG